MNANDHCTRERTLASAYLENKDKELELVLAELGEGKGLLDCFLS